MVTVSFFSLWFGREGNQFPIGTDTRERLGIRKEKIAGERREPIIYFSAANVKLEIFVVAILIADGAEVPGSNPALVYSVCAG